MKIKCLKKDAPITTNKQGGKQSKVDYAFTLFDPPAMFNLANVLHHGFIKYGKDNWRAIDVDSHLNHALMHIYAYLSGDNQDDHLGHALCRLMMAVAKKLRPKYLGVFKRKK